MWAKWVDLPMRVWIVPYLMLELGCGFRPWRRHFQLRIGCGSKPRWWRRVWIWWGSSSSTGGGSSWASGSGFGYGVVGLAIHMVPMAMEAIAITTTIRLCMDLPEITS
ncbi:hypothetical protein Pyn_12804 [Prunus yedoensis var. nudiflora]|uniref:Uncharacterized protein n=1 Tax=Prunus yedoensis var. nudiflora TaxID=2094558 RepID=A0A314XH16_PRUYE|nr:hypothetical protein Pyn_12804 [Prunus yedoensis var. nudiflora]